jgi:uncharacterized protein YndB with AHSA1/START domain
VTLEVRRTIRASAERLYAAWTRPEQLLRWWGPRHVTCVGAEIDLRPGGRYRLANRFLDGRVLWISGAFEQVQPPHRLVYTWFLEPASDGTPPPVQLPPHPERITVRFEPRQDATEVIVVHERIESEVLSNQHRQGWEGCLERLAEFAEQTAAAD